MRRLHVNALSRAAAVGARGGGRRGLPGVVVLAGVCLLLLGLAYITVMTPARTQAPTLAVADEPCFG